MPVWDPRKRGPLGLRVVLAGLPLGSLPPSLLQGLRLRELGWLPRHRWLLHVQVALRWVETHRGSPRTVASGSGATSIACLTLSLEESSSCTESPSTDHACREHLVLAVSGFHLKPCFAARWLGCKNSMLSEISQKQKDKCLTYVTGWVKNK